MADPDKDVCYIGKLCEEKCNIQFFHSQKDVYHKLSEVSEDDINILAKRVANFKKNQNEKICDFHLRKYTVNYSQLQLHCCDPFNKHTKKVKVNLKELQVQLCDNVEKLEHCKLTLIPGKKVCHNCMSDIVAYFNIDRYCCNPFKYHRYSVDDNLVKLDTEFCEKYFTTCNVGLDSDKKVCFRCYNSIVMAISRSEHDSKTSTIIPASSVESSEELLNVNTENQNFSENISSSGSEFCATTPGDKKLESIFTALNIPVINKFKYNKSSLKNKAIDVLEKTIDIISDTMISSLEIDLSSFKNLREIKQKSDYFESLVNNILSKYNKETNISKKISILTLLPENWKYRTVKQYFSDCSRYMWQVAQRLKESKGVLAESTKKEYHLIPEDVQKSIIEYYLDDCNSRMCSGMNEYVRVETSDGKFIKVQKRLLLFNIKDIYYNYLEGSSNLERIPSFSLFASLRPKQCVFAGSPCTHNICVCPFHQNVKLKLSVLNQKHQYRNLIEKSVCSIDNKNCMFRTYHDCPTKNSILQIINVGKTPTEVIIYKNWVQERKSSSESFSNVTTLKQIEETCHIFINKLVDDIWELSKHHFITECQKNSLFYMKNNLEQDTCLILMDFAEKYGFIVQDSTQGYYFNNKSATVHPVVVYFKDAGENNLKVQSFCVISDTIKQTASTVNIFLEKVLDIIKSDFCWIKKVIYFTDGSPTQYKNKNHFINLCNHEQDFKLKVMSHNFFTTSHGKSACDGVGAAAKRETRKASLQRSLNNQIQTPKEMFDFLDKSNSVVRFVYVSNQEVEARERKLHKRFADAKTVPHTREYHSFEPLDSSRIRIKYFTADEESFIVNISK